MKNISITKYLLLLLILGCAKSKNVEVGTVLNFEILNNNSLIDTPIEFKNTSKFVNKFIWYFGDGDSSLNVNVNHKYKQKGVYNVTLKGITNNVIETISKTVTINEDTVLIVDFTIECPKPFVGSAKAKFINKSVNALRYEWSYNELIDTNVNIDYEFLREKTHGVRLLAYSKNGGYKYLDKQIKIKFEPDTMVISELIIEKTPTVMPDNSQIDIGNDPDYYIAISNWRDTTRILTPIILNNKLFPLTYNFKNNPIELLIPYYSTSPIFNYITIFDGDQSNQKIIDFLTLNSREFFNYNGNKYPSEFTITNRNSTTILKFKVSWK